MSIVQPSWYWPLTPWNDCTRQTFGLVYQTFVSLNGSFAALAPGVKWEDGLGDLAFPSPNRFTSQDTIVLRMAHFTLLFPRLADTSRSI